VRHTRFTRSAARAAKGWPHSIGFGEGLGAVGRHQGEATKEQEVQDCPHPP
jgi:hypothetical protein